MLNEKICQLAIEVGNLLKKRSFKLVAIESCTGGGLAEALTAVCGSSVYFDCGMVTYSNEAKIELAGVKPEVLQKYGAVSPQVAEEMVVGGLRHSHAQVGVAVTGFAGPGGGSEQYPVGSVCFAFKICDQPAIIAEQHFSGNRQEVRMRAVIFALEQLLPLLK